MDAGRGKGTGGGEPERGLPEFGKRHRELITQGDRLKWVRHQLGPTMWEPMPREELAPLLAKLSGEKQRSPTTIFRWEQDEGSPSLKEAVVYARLCGRTVEWLSGIEEYLAAQNPTVAMDEHERERILMQGHHRGVTHKRRKPKDEEPARPRGAVPGPPPSASRRVALPSPDVKKKGQRRRGHG